MSLHHIFGRVASKYLILIFVVLSLVSCGAAYQLYAPPNATLHTALPGNYENPDLYRVTYIARYSSVLALKPPSPRYKNLNFREPMASIEPSDIWTVTHQINGRLIIFSQQYQARQEKVLSGKTNDLYSLLIDADGRVNKGWFLFKNPRIVVLKSERMEIMDPSIRDSDGWPDEPLFLLKK